MLRWLTVCATCLALGCASRTRVVTIYAKPADAVIRVDGRAGRRGPITHEFEFGGSKDVHYVSATRPGFKEERRPIRAGYAQDHLLLELRPLSRAVTITVSPLPAKLFIDGRPLAAEPLSEAVEVLEFTDARGDPITHELTAERPGFQPAAATIAWRDQTQAYALRLRPLPRDVTILVDPPDAPADVYVNDKLYGTKTNKIIIEDYIFPTDPATGQFVPQQVKAVAPGYGPGHLTASFDDPEPVYRINLKALSKVVRIVTDPPGASVFIEGKELDRDADGASTTALQFPRLDGDGGPRAWDGVAVRKEGGEEVARKQFTIGWDEGKAEYQVSLERVSSREVPLLEATPAYSGAAWRIEPQELSTVAFLDAGEPAGGKTPSAVRRFPKGVMPGTLAISPDGGRCAFTLIRSADGVLRSQLQGVDTDGGGEVTQYGDGNALDLTPSFTPDGTKIVFASDRAPGASANAVPNLWSVPANAPDDAGPPPAERLTEGESTDLWPSVDFEPAPNLFYQSMAGGSAEPRLLVLRAGADAPEPVGTTPGTQPRVSPRGDSILFADADPKTGKRDVYQVSDADGVPLGGEPVNLTSSPDADDFDPAWSSNGSSVAFTSDRGHDSEGRNNRDVWMMNLADPKRPLVQVTRNGSWDDSPAWDPAGRAIYFRSNRGGTWGIWKIDVR